MKQLKKRLNIAIGWGMIILMLQGCAKDLPAGDFCNLYSPIYMTDTDSELTKKQIDKNNVIWFEMCR